VVVLYGGCTASAAGEMTSRPAEGDASSIVYGVYMMKAVGRLLRSLHARYVCRNRSLRARCLGQHDPG
jgi:hypothetical protein